MQVQLYTPVWKEAIIRLNVEEYPFMSPWFQKRFETMYESNYQHEKCRLIIAVDDEKLAGVISYIRWPMNTPGRAVNSYQMVGLVVNPEFRGRGVFSMLLEKLKEEAKQDHAEFMFGFPVEVSRAGFLKHGWTHVFDLQWFVRPLNPFAALRRRDFSGIGFSNEVPESLAADEYLQTAADPVFWKYRNNLMPEWPAWWYQTEIGPYSLCFQLRTASRKGLKEAIIGKIYPGNAPASVIATALKLLFKALRKEGSIFFVSIAVNTACGAETIKAVRSLFMATGKRIHFINLGYGESSSKGLDPGYWNIMRGDMETW